MSTEILHKENESSRVDKWRQRQLQCVSAGHQIVALANLHPANTGKGGCRGSVCRGHSLRLPESTGGKGAFSETQTCTPKSFGFSYLHTAYPLAPETVQSTCHVSLDVAACLQN
ncbi:hypothetical protein J4Q44_G00251620 [Coregonus suidteri]|uniref:Uncharacterized protein n=1 Tax=Coregonus suidteri TaxID=861788 RepID=A0AAN8LNB2_9TELE